jgi:sortase A
VVIEITRATADPAEEEKVPERVAEDVVVDPGDTEGSPRRSRRAQRSGPPAPSVGTVVLALVMLTSVTVAFFGVFAFGLSGLQEQRSQHLAYAQLRGLLHPSSPLPPYLGGRIPAGAPVALLNAPRAGLRDTVVVEGTSGGDLLAGPGHLSNTPLPGQAGNAVLLGKAATAGAPFSRVTDLRRGDSITVRTGQGLFHYRVRGHLVNGGRLPRIPATSGFLVLGTSAGSGAFASLSPSHVVYVYARLVGSAKPAPHGRPHTVPSSQLPGHNDPGAWPFVALWTIALLAASAACWWLWSYWGLLRTWIIGAPVLFALLWAFSDEAMRLLPNVY